MLFSELSAAFVIISGEVVISQPSFIFGGEASAYGKLASLEWGAAASTVVLSGIQPVFLRLVALIFLWGLLLNFLGNLCFVLQFSNRF